MVQLGIAVVVSDEVHNAIRGLQLAIAEAAGGNPALDQSPHITLKQPFHARALDPVEGYFDGLVASAEPCEIRLHGIGFFEADRVVFLDVAPNPRLEALRLRVLRDLGEQFGVRPREVEDQRYRFHASLAYNLSEEQWTKALHAVRDGDVDLRFTLDTLGLFYYTGELWILYKRSRLTAR